MNSKTVTDVTVGAAKRQITTGHMRAAEQDVEWLRAGNPLPISDMQCNGCTDTLLTSL